MDAIKYEKMGQVVKATKSKAAWRNPIAWLSIVLMVLAASYLVAFVYTSAPGLHRIENLTSNQTYINSLATNSIQMAKVVVAIQVDTVLNLWTLAILISGGLVLFVCFVIPSTTPKYERETKSKILNNLREAGYCDKEIKEFGLENKYLKGRLGIIDIMELEKMQKNKKGE